MKQQLFCYKLQEPAVIHSLRNYYAIHGFLCKVSIATLRRAIHGLRKIHTLRITYNILYQISIDIVVLWTKGICPVSYKKFFHLLTV